MSTRWFVVVALALVARLAGAAPVLSEEAPLREPSTGVRFDPHPQVAGTTFQCLGTGLRKVFLFEVYAVTYCLEPAQVKKLDAYVDQKYPGFVGEPLVKALRSDPGFYGRLALSPGDHLVLMHAVRDFSRRKMGEAFRDSLKSVLSPEKINTLIAAIPADVKDGDDVRIYRVGDELTIDIAGRKNTIVDAEIAEKLWDVWLSGKSVTPALRRTIAERAAARVGRE